MSNYGVVSTLNAPRLESPTQPNMIKFEVDYAAYKEYITDLNRTRDESEQIQPATIRQCIKPEMLHSLCILGEIENASTVEEATDEVVEKWFEASLKIAPKDIAERVQASLDAVKYKLCPQDPGGDAREYVVNVVMNLDRNNASEVVKDSEICKTIVPKLINRVEPAELRIRLLNKKTYWTAVEKSSISHLMKRASALAVEVHNGETARAQLKRQNNRDAKRPASADARQTENNNVKRLRTGPELRKDGKPSRSSQVWDKPCLNKKKCKQLHRISDCEVTTAEERKILLDEFYAEKKRRKSVKTLACRSANRSDGRYDVLLEECTAAVAIGDYGSDFSAISKDVVERINDKYTLNVIDLPDVMKLEMAVKSTKTNPIIFTARQKTTMSIVITLPRTKIPIHLHGIEFLVTDQAMNEVILGRPLLKSIGFDLDDHLEKVGPEINGKSINRVSAKGYSEFYRGVSFQDTEDDPIEPPEHLTAGFGIDVPRDIDAALSALTANAAEKGMTDTGVEKLKDILQEYRSIFRIKLGMDPPANVPPLQIQLRPGAKPSRGPQRRYAENQRVFISHTIKQLEKIGAVYRNPTAKWASPALAVPKPGSDKLRFTVDLRSVNSKTVPLQSAMPHLESKLQECSGSAVFANIDFCHGYWQFALSPESEERMSIQTPIGIYSPRRMLQGGTDTGNHFQACTQAIFADATPNLIQWIDDFLLHAKNEDQLLKTIKDFFSVCKRSGFKVNPKKSNLYQTSVKFCGRIISKDGVQYDPRCFEALVNMKTPNTASELQQLLCATNWMRTSIPDYARRIQPLHNLMEESYATAGSRKKTAVRKINLSEKWNATHPLAFEDVKRHLVSATKLAHPKKNHSVCLFTDASETHWAATLTQIPDEQRKLHLDLQEHEPLAFLSGAFRDSAEHWSTPEKEGFAIVEAMTRLDYLVLGRVVTIFTDQANLVNMYDPYGRNPSVPRHTASKLMRWAMKLSGFRYIIQHLPGERNVWPDMLTRWAVKTPDVVQMKSRNACKTILLAPVNPEASKELDWPTRHHIKDEQQKSNHKPPQGLLKVNGVWQDTQGRLWIPGDGAACQMRILIAAHAGAKGHRAEESTKANIDRFFIWDGLSKDVHAFISSCLHCLASQSGYIVPRPLGSAMHATKPNEIIHFDYCSMGKGRNHFKYVLVVKDDLSGYVWLRPTKCATAETTAETLIQWFAAFGTARTWVSDQGSHFRNTVIANLKNQLHTQHHFTLAYTPWSNGTVEVVCRELSKISRSLMSEFQLPLSSWPSIMPIVQSALNNSPFKRLNHKCPQEVFTCLEQDSPFAAMVERKGKLQTASISETRMKQIKGFEDCKAAMDRMHREVAFSSSKKGNAAIESQNRKTGVRPINFSEGDYVLKNSLQKKRKRKLVLRWTGLFRVVECKSNYIFDLEHLTTKQRQLVHGMEGTARQKKLVKFI